MNVEGEKGTLFLCARNSSYTNMSVLKYFYKLSPAGRKVLWAKKHDIENPYDQPQDIIRRCEKNDTSMYMLISHQKKRQNAVIFTRLFDFNVLDTYEFLIKTIDNNSNLLNINLSPHMKPVLIFEGSEFNNDALFKGIKSYFTDFFKGDPEKQYISINNIDICLVFSIKTCTADEKIICLNSYYMVKTKDNDELKISLETVTTEVEMKLTR